MKASESPLIQVLIYGEKRPGPQPSAVNDSGLQLIRSHLWWSRGRFDGESSSHQSGFSKYQKTLSTDLFFHRCWYAFAALPARGRGSGDRWEKHVSYTTTWRTHVRSGATHSSGWIPIGVSEVTIRFPCPHQPDKYPRVTTRRPEPDLISCFLKLSLSSLATFVYLLLFGPACLPPAPSSSVDFPANNALVSPSVLTPRAPLSFPLARSLDKARGGLAPARRHVRLWHRGQKDQFQCSETPCSPVCVWTTEKHTHTHAHV